MNTNKTPELSYFRLKLTAYLRDHHPELTDDATLISSRADGALTAYCDAVEQGFSHPEAETIASNVLFESLHFSKYDTLVSVLEEEFASEFPAPLPERLAPILLRQKAIQDVFARYDLTEEFIASAEYEELYTELTGTIVLLIEANGLPTLK